MNQKSPTGPAATAGERHEQQPVRIYQDYYHLAEPPFSITPDPGFLFYADCHRQILDKVDYAIRGRMGFVLLTGEVGTGKTTLCRFILDRWQGKADTAYVINPSVSGRELLSGILEDAGMSPAAHATKKELLDRLYQRLLDNGADRPMLVIIDDAQTMTADTLEDLRLLSNLETDKQKLLQVVLSGQPELLELLAKNDLRQLKQRIAIHCKLVPLPGQETDAYISRRLSAAGNKGQVQFSHAATRKIHLYSGGIPRQINKICDFALTAGYVNDASVIGPKHVKRVLEELGGLDLPTKRKRRVSISLLWPVLATILSLLVIVFTLRSGTVAPKAATADLPVVQNQMPRSPSVGAAASAEASRQPSTSEPMDVTEGAPALDGTRASTDMHPVNTDVAAGMTGREQTAAGRLQTTPYALQLGSFRSVDHAKRGERRFRAKGVAAHWQILEASQWYRLVAGQFESVEAAKQYMTAYRLDDAIVIRVPYTVEVVPDNADFPDTQAPLLLSQLGYNCRMETGPTGDERYHTGFFKSYENASEIAGRIASKGIFHTRVVARMMTRPPVTPAVACR